MTAIVARPPLHPLSMSSSQRQSRRISARVQEQEATTADENGNARAQDSQKNAALRGNARKRKPSYDEEDDGFMFSRVKKNKKDEPKPPPILEEPVTTTAITTKKDATPSKRQGKPATQVEDVQSQEPARKRQKKKMSFSTPVPAEKEPVRRSKRLSQEDQPASPKHKSRRKETVIATETTRPPAPQEQPLPSEAGTESKITETDNVQPEQPAHEVQESHSATKIALPFADTPVIRRNKEMRENKGKKGERRSSLSLRGRRASSLIESGNSNALPHDEVAVADFYKHIESEGLPEPRRMRQLLTWCATRSLDQKPMGATFEVSSAIAAARVIQDELLKDLGNKSELSDWFAREDTVASPKELPERPNPKNIQNTEKIAELERQIQRLRVERDALEQLLKPTTTRSLPKTTGIDATSLSPDEATILEQLQSTQSRNIGSRVEAILDRLEPSVDAFADKVHRVAQYRDGADNVASRVLSIAAEKLAERETESRRRAQPERDRSPGQVLGSVLRGLSRADR